MTTVASATRVAVALVGERHTHNEVHQSTDIYRKSHKLTHIVNCLILQVGRSLELILTYNVPSPPSIRI
jgi:hypothetical protein